MRFLASLLLGFLFCAVAQAQPVGLDPVLTQQALAGQPLEAVVVMRTQADLSDAWLIDTKEAKGQFVYQTLTQTASSTQAGLISMFSAQPHLRWSAHWLVNCITIWGADLAILEALAARADVQAVIANGRYVLQQPVEVIYGSKTTNEVAWGITMIGADQVWAMGYKGQGIVIGSADTGVDPFHPAIEKRYRGYTPGGLINDYNWHDCIHDLPGAATNACGFDSPVPCDDGSHGTHTVGTMVSEETEQVFGVAPQAQWVAIRNMNNGNGTLDTYLEGFEWFIAPTDGNGQNPDPALAPHIINNSWYCSVSEGCNETNFFVLDQGLTAVRAAGIVPVVSVGNAGPLCGSATGPPGFMVAAFSIGASRSDDTIAGYSSRGPVVIDGSNRLKPDVSAPGSQILSCVPNFGYATLSGTSMAGPHVAGAVALILSARPELAGQVDAIQQILQSTAKPLVDTAQCGGLSVGTIPNHAAGYGRINVLAAVQQATTTQMVQNKSLLTLLPNPASQLVSIGFEPSTETARLVIVDMQGRMLFEQTLLPGSTQSSVPTGHWLSGTYLVMLYQKQSLHRQVMLVQNE